MRKRIAAARGDLTGDGAAETLILSGEQNSGSAYWQNIELDITDGRTGRTVRVPLAHDEGYDPQVLLSLPEGTTVAVGETATFYTTGVATMSIPAQMNAIGVEKAEN